MQISKHSTVLPTVKTINSLPARPGHWTTTCATVERFSFMYRSPQEAAIYQPAVEGQHTRSSGPPEG